MKNLIRTSIMALTLSMAVIQFSILEAQVVTINSPKALDAYQPGENITVDWEPVEGADLYIVKSTAQNHLGTYTYVGDIKCHAWGKHKCNISHMYFDLGCSALPGPQRIQVTAHREKRLKNHEYKQIGIGEQVIYMEADMLPRKPEIIPYCGQSNGPICLDPMRLGYKDKNGSWVESSENRIVQWWSTLEEATQDAMGQAQGPPLHEGLCYEPPEPIEKLTIYYINTRSTYGCGSGLPSVVAVVVVPVDRLPLAADQDPVELQPDEYLPPDLKCTAPISAHILKVNESALDQILGNAQVLSMNTQWFHNNNGVLEEGAFMTQKKLAGENVLHVCYEDVRYENKAMNTLNKKFYRDYKAITLLELQVNIEGRTRTFDCQLEGDVRIHVPETEFVYCNETEVCTQKSTTLNPGEVPLPELQYDWDPKQGLSDPTIPSPKVLPLELPLNQTVEFILTRSLKNSQVSTESKSCFQVTRIPDPCLGPADPDDGTRLELSMDPGSDLYEPGIRLLYTAEDILTYEVRSGLNMVVDHGQIGGPFNDLLPLSGPTGPGSYSFSVWSNTGLSDHIYLLIP